MKHPHGLWSVATIHLFQLRFFSFFNICQGNKTLPPTCRRPCVLFFIIGFVFVVCLFSELFYWPLFFSVGRSGLCYLPAMGCVHINTFQLISFLCQYSPLMFSLFICLTAFSSNCIIEF